MAASCANELRVRVIFSFTACSTPDRLGPSERKFLRYARREGGSRRERIQPTGSPMANVIYLDPEPDYVKVYGEIQAVEGFHRLGHSQAIIQVMGALLGDQVLPHANKIARIMFPQEQ